MSRNLRFEWSLGTGKDIGLLSRLVTEAKEQWFRSAPKADLDCRGMIRPVADPKGYLTL